MAQFQFNASQHAPRYSASDGLPAGKHPVVIVASEFRPTKDSTPSDPRSMLALTLQAIDGPAKGSKQTDRLNLQHPNMQTVSIAQAQLSAYCMVTGRPGFSDTSALHNIPFIAEIGPQKNNDQYTEVKGLYFIDGRDVSAGAAQAASAPFAPAPAAPTANIAAQPAAASTYPSSPQPAQPAPAQAPTPTYAPAPVGNKPPWER